MKTFYALFLLLPVSSLFAGEPTPEGPPAVVAPGAPGAAAAVAAQRHRRTCSDGRPAGPVRQRSRSFDLSAANDAAGARPIDFSAGAHDGESDAVSVVALCAEGDEGNPDELSEAASGGAGAAGNEQ